MRIIAGKYKGLQLNTFEYGNIRPTIDRVRENIFNIIQFRIADSDILDLFGGTGAVSLEFVSRGAKRVTICDNNKDSVSLIKKNFAKAKETPNLIVGDYLNALEKLKHDKFNLIFLDPPYDTDFGERALEFISKNNMLLNDGLIIFEHIVGKEFKIPANYEINNTRKYGTVEVSFIGCKND
ncbi:MAG: 16S rRNA (guanine(966)-N(2))-methyltransferase RsmD [Clostridiales bacterium]|nr:16S rRNA (guanine(966)-N(2))-methyltransferase RsmD [Clostridiales bacterium]